MLRQSWKEIISNIEPNKPQPNNRYGLTTKQTGHLQRQIRLSNLKTLLNAEVKK